jgi:hypothetical protein
MQRTEQTSACHQKTQLMRRQISLRTVSACGLCSLLIGSLAVGQETADTYRLGRDAEQGKKIAPVPLNLTRKNAQLIYRGSYIVNGHGGCNSCHTCPSYKATNPFKIGANSLGSPDSPGPINTVNYLAGGTPFLGRGTPFQGSILISANLTPDSSGRPGGMTFQDFLNAMQNGEVSSKPGHILQVMPWPTFRHLYQNDLRAIYEYLSAIPSAKPGTCTGDEQTGN